MLKVLVVEDEEMIRKGIVLAVDWAAMDCVVVGEAANGVEALEAVERLNPSLIITDLKMPRMDGIEMLRCLRERGNHVYVIILTAYDSFTYAQSALRLGAVDFLLKPFHDGDLEQAVTALRRRMGGAEREEPALPGLKKGDKSKYVLEAMDYIGKHYQDPNISISDIALDLGISEGHLSRTFKKETDYTLLNYLTRYRIHKAMELLRDCRVKVYEVAAQVGYRDITYFSAGDGGDPVGISGHQWKQEGKTLIRLIASDIDGTLLLNGATEIPQEIFYQIDRLERKGILFCPASGRQYSSLRKLFAPVADRVPFLCENGAVVYGPGNPGPVLSKTAMGRSLAEELCRDILALPGVEVLISGANISYLCPKDPAEGELVHYFVGNNTTQIPAPEEVPEDIVKVSAYCPGRMGAIPGCCGRGGLAGFYFGGQRNRSETAVQGPGHRIGGGYGIWRQLQRPAHAGAGRPALDDGQRR